MMRFKDYTKTDLDTFFNLDEFAEIHEIGGYKAPAVIDSDIVKIRSQSKSERFDGIYKGEIVVYVKSKDLPFRPVYGQDLRLDGKLYFVVECSEDMGVLEITLGADES